MSWTELLRMSASNLRRRKLRTFLTVLGVVIGTASIVVMVSLGLGMQRSMYAELEEYGGMKTIKVYGSGNDSYLMGYSSAAGEEMDPSEEYVDDDCIEMLKKLEHVQSAEPVYTVSAILLKGSYEGWTELTAMTPEGLAGRKIEFEEGGLPTQGQLELVYGNQIITNFTEKNSGSSYWDTGELPDIDLAKDSLFLILDEENYYASQEATPFDNMGAESGESGEASKPVQVQKHVVQASGVVAGGLEDYNANSYSVYCDLDALKQVLKKEFAGRTIPGQPQTQNGKPLNRFCYSYAELEVDDVDNVISVSNQIKELGYSVETNAELMDSMKRQMAIIQAVLGGIGAVSLFVAAIGIANTMMMSIYERTKEIGVMKVLGCSLKNIRIMFLMEAGFIGVIGGVIGNALSFIVSRVINVIAGSAQEMGLGANISYIPLWLMLASIGFAMLVGILAGYFPAKRAMKLSPLEAIRNN